MDTLGLGCILPTTRVDWGLSPIRNVRRKAHYDKKTGMLSHSGSSRVREKIRTPDLLIRSQTLYPAELRAHIKLYNKYYYKLAKTSSAGDRDRTGTGGKSRRILSPVRLPVPPRRHLQK